LRESLRRKEGFREGRRGKEGRRGRCAQDEKDRVGRVTYGGGVRWVVWGGLREGNFNIALKENEGGWRSTSDSIAALGDTTGLASPAGKRQKYEPGCR